MSLKADYYHWSPNVQRWKTFQEACALAKTCDLFSFYAFTSLRYSDMASLKRADIDGDKIYITTQKTNDRLPIDLSRNVQTILDKYKDVIFPMGRALPVISNHTHKSNCIQSHQ